MKVRFPNDNGFDTYNVVACQLDTNHIDLHLWIEGLAEPIRITPTAIGKDDFWALVTLLQSKFPILAS